MAGEGMVQPHKLAPGAAPSASSWVKGRGKGDGWKRNGHGTEREQTGAGARVGPRHPLTRASLRTATLEKNVKWVGGFGFSVWLWVGGLVCL